MNKVILLKIILFYLVLQSCLNKTTNEIQDSVKNVNTENTRDLNLQSKVEIDFTENKKILDIILLLPDTVFSSWSWKLEDRIKWYNEIKANNYYIDNDPNFFNQKYFEPTKAGFQIVDGFWSINIYKTSDNSYIVISNDIVGDGNDINFFEVKSNKIQKYLNEKVLTSEYKELLKKKNTDENCNEIHEELDGPIFNYNFIDDNKIEIESSWFLIKENYDNCLIGNSIVYNFNAQSKKFEVEKIYWKQKQIEH